MDHVRTERGSGQACQGRAKPLRDAQAVQGEQHAGAEQGHQDARVGNRVVHLVLVGDDRGEAGAGRGQPPQAPPPERAGGKREDQGAQDRVDQLVRAEAPPEARQVEVRHPGQIAGQRRSGPQHEEGDTEAPGPPARLHQGCEGQEQDHGDVGVQVPEVVGRADRGEHRVERQLAGRCVVGAAQPAPCHVEHGPHGERHQDPYDPLPQLPAVPDRGTHEDDPSGDREEQRYGEAARGVRDQARPVGAGTVRGLAARRVHEGRPRVAEDHADRAEQPDQIDVVPVFAVRAGFGGGLRGLRGGRRAGLGDRGRHGHRRLRTRGPRVNSAWVNSHFVRVSGR